MIETSMPEGDVAAPPGQTDKGVQGSA